MPIAPPLRPTTRRLLLRRVAALALIASLHSEMVAVAAQTGLDAATAERRVKAAYLYKFAGYVEWPEGAFPQPDSPFVITVLDNDKLADDLAAMARQRPIGGRSVEVRRASTAEALAGTHILFADRGRGTRLPEAMASMQPRFMLVVTDAPGALAQGSIINFILVDGSVRFEISLEAAEKRGIKLSSRLIGVAQNAPGKAR